MKDHRENAPSGAVAGGLLLAAAIAAVLFITQHPTLGAPGHDSLADEAVAEAAFNGFIHGAMILFALVYYYAMSIASVRLGALRHEVRAAQLAFAAATIAMIGAPLVSGFIISGLASSYAAGGADADDLFHAQLHMLGQVNQTLAKAGTVWYGAAILFWSWRLVAMPGLTRAAGVYGLLAGPLLAGSIIVNHLRLDVHGMALALIVIGVWFSLVGLQMLRRKI